MIEYVDIVDASGNILSKTTRSFAHKQGLLHQTSKVLLFNSVGKILLQQRSSKKIIFPLCFDISVAEHVLAGEIHSVAAVRGLKEELSIDPKIVLLRNNHIQTSNYKIKNGVSREHELVKLYGCIFSKKIRFNPKEVNQVIHIDMNKLKDLLSNKDVDFTPWGRDELLYLLRNYKKIINRIQKIIN